MKRVTRIAAAAFASALLFARPASAAPFVFSTGSTTNLIATTSRPDAGGKIETETADDFLLNNETVLNSATFTGLLTGGATLANVGQVGVEFYRVFPLDSTVPPSGNVTTRANSPSDVAFADRDTAAANLTFSATTLSANFTALNSVLNGINKFPNQHTNGEGPVSGTEVQFTVNFTTPIDLPKDHYFFIPQVQVTGGEFMWLSAERPITTGTPFAPDLQAWIRNANLDPDWSRVGTDIVGGATPPTFNMSFSLNGADAAGVAVAPLPSALKSTAPLAAIALLIVGARRARYASRPTAV